MSYEKPSLKIKTDTYVDDQFMENGTERLTLNNNLQDPSLINQCLGYGVFAAAGLPAPRCNFAVVTVNGQDLGVYTHVEAVKKDFLKRHFTVPDGDLYEGTLSDFYDGAIGTFDAKTDDTDEDLEVIHEIRDALDAPDDEIIERLGAIIDLPAFYRFWAVETLVGHGDGYASNQNNFLIYRDPGTELVTFIPWGMDTLFQGVEYQPPAFITAWITQRLWSIPAGRDAYVEAMDEILETAWDEEALHDEIDRMEDLLTSHARDPATAAAYMDLARDYVDGRRASVTSQLPEMAGWDIDPEMRDPFCIVEEGTIDSEFNTLYDTLDAEDPFIYPATLYGESFPGDLYLGSVAGMDQDRFVVATYAVTEDWNTLYQVVAYVPAGVTPGTYDLAFGSAYAIAIDINVPDDEGDIIGLIFGTVTFDEVGENPGDPVVGRHNRRLVKGGVLLRARLDLL